MGGRGGSSGITAKGPTPPQAPKGPTKASEAKDFTELKDYMKTKHGITFHSSLSNLDFDLIRDGADSIERLMAEFPKLGRLTSSVGDRLSSGAGYNTYAETNCRGDINLNAQRYGSKTALDRDTIKDANSRFHPANTKSESVIIHELGHSIDVRLGQMKGTGPWSTSDSIVREALKNIKAQTGRKYDEIIAHTSRYPLAYRSARDRNNEVFAEAISDYMTNGSNARTLSKEIWRITKREAQ